MLINLVIYVKFLFFVPLIWIESRKNLQVYCDMNNLIMITCKMQNINIQIIKKRKLKCKIMCEENSII